MAPLLYISSVSSRETPGLEVCRWRRKKCSTSIVQHDLPEQLVLRPVEIIIVHDNNVVRDLFECGVHAFRDGGLWFCVTTDKTRTFTEGGKGWRGLGEEEVEQ